MTSTPRTNLPLNSPLSLFAIMQEHLQLVDQVADADGEVTPELETALGLNGDQLQAKATSVAYVIKTVDYNIDVLDKEIARLQELKTKAAKAKEFLMQRLSEAMQLFGIERLDGGNIKLFFRKSEAVEIFAQPYLPDEFLEWKDPIPNKKKIKEAIKAGEEVPGARLITRQNLQIK